MPALIISISFALALGGAAKATPIAHLTLASQPGDFIGQGGNFDITYTPTNSQFFLVSTSSTAFVIFLLGTPTLGSDNTFTDLSFATNQPGTPLQPGSYFDAQRAASPAPGHPGLEVSFQNRGCFTLTGNFTVQTAQFILGGTGGTAVVDRFAATFEQHCEGAIPALFGTFSFDSDPSRIPEPTSLPLTAFGLLVFWIIKKRGLREQP